MLKSYAAIYQKGRLNWLDDIPPQDNMKVIVTFVEAIPQLQAPLFNAQKILQQAWNCLEKKQTIQQIDADIAKMRSEWE